MKKNFIALVVYDRYHNLQRWLHCWNLCEKHDFELVIIHNTDVEQPAYRSICDYYGVKYIQRPNVGYDTAPFQDICLERLQGFDNDWNLLMWATDDWFPMSKNFIKQYVNHYEHGVVGVVCTEISDQVKRHIRTSGFLISKEISKKLTFDAEVITSKEDCYNFEHLSPNAFLEQIEIMNLKAELVSPLHIAPMWDSEHRASLNRMDEHNSVFYSTNKVIVLCPIYNSFPQIVSSMISQTHKDWELYLIHDGKSEYNIADYVNLLNDSRIKYIETEERVGNYGHPIRKEYLNKFIKSDADYILITNGDNYHTPNCLEVMIKGFDTSTVATYCESMAHSYINWKIIECRLERGYLDCAGVMVRKDVSCNVGWNDVDSHSSDWTYFEDIAKIHGWHTFKKVEGCLLIHN
jgi:hypothetical protein